MNHNSMLEAEIVACEQQLYTAQLSSDVALLQELLSDELVFVSPSGEIITKQMDLELHRSGGMKVTSLEPQELEIRISESPKLVKIRLDAGVKAPEFIYLEQLELGTL